MSPPHVLLPLTSSLLYVAAALLLKRAADMGVGVWRTTFVGNMLGAAMFTSLLFLGGEVPSWTLLWQPAIVALLLVTGQSLAFLSLTAGDVSVATPLLGVKTVLVALFTTVVASQSVPLKLWIGAALSTTAIGMLGRSARGQHHHLSLTVTTAMLAAACYALFDVLVQTWAPAWGAGRFLPIMNGFAALYSLGLVPLFREPLAKIERRVWPWLLGGAFLLGLQGILFIGTIAVYGNATATNIVYSARGVWSVLLVWWLGGWFKSQEQDMGRGVLIRRLVGAGLITAAVVTVLA